MEFEGEVYWTIIEDHPVLRRDVFKGRGRYHVDALRDFAEQALHELLQWKDSCQQWQVAHQGLEDSRENVVSQIDDNCDQRQEIDWLRVRQNLEQLEFLVRRQVAKEDQVTQTMVEPVFCCGGASFCGGCDGGCQPLLTMDASMSVVRRRCKRSFPSQS